MSRHVGLRAGFFLLVAASSILGMLGCLPILAPGPPTYTATFPTARIRVATFNTKCIVPEMSDDVMTHLDSIMEGKLPCLPTISGFIGDLINLAMIGIDTTGFFSPLDYREKIEDDVKFRADNIASYILERSDIDVIAFNEVFLEDARDLFVSRLKGKFPYYVRKIQTDTPCTEDSGLMLFSRFPFASLPSGVVANWGVEAVANGSAWTEVGRVTFGPCNCEDCLADKSAGLVRIQHPLSGDFYYVVFTHLQADPTACVWATPGDEVWDTRTNQLRQIADLLDQALGSQGYKGDTNVIVTGDLNVNGTQPLGLAALNLPEPDTLEWYLKFHPVGARAYYDYYADNPYLPPTTAKLYDTWAATTSPYDPGITNGTANRLDYIFMNAQPRPWSRRMVPQHMTILFDKTMSDHLGVHAVINDWQAYCTPVEASAPQAGQTLDTWPNNQKYERQITVPGGFQWFRFDLPGTYSFALQSASGQNEASDFELRVYKHTDLTFEVSNYYGEETDIGEYFSFGRGIMSFTPTIPAKKYVVPETPLYVRVSPKAESGTGKYALYVHRHEGRSKKDAIVLPANCTQDFHSAQPVNDVDMPWFQLNLEAADTGQPQSLRFIALWNQAEIGQEGPPLTLRLQDDADTVVAEDSSFLYSNPNVDENNPAYGETTIWRYVEILHNDLEKLGTRFFLRVQRPSLAYVNYKMRWETNLTVLHGYISTATRPLELYAEDETCSDGTGSDEIRLKVYVDGDGYVKHSLSQSQIGSGDADTGDSFSLDHLIPPIRFLHHVNVTIIEDDTSGNDAGAFVIYALPPRNNTSWKQSVTTSIPCSGVVAIGDDGTYRLYYNLSRSLECSCD